MSLSPHVETGRLQQELDTLASFTQCEQTGNPGERAVTRIVFSEDDLRARASLKSLYAEAGLQVREDAVGNTFARWAGTETELPAVCTGSHIDAIPHAGMYDGTVGVLGGLEAIRALQRCGYRPRRSIELLMFTAEEPTRFGIGCLGSRLLAGTLDPARADALLDSNGMNLAELRQQAGYHGSLENIRLRPGHYSAFLELHIEQGPLLERDGLQLGLVTDIAAPASYRIRIDGAGGHAGALLMPDRRDAMCAAAEVILAVERAAFATGAIDTVATVGTARIYPGAVNSVPSRVDLELDVRDTDPGRRESVLDAVYRASRDIESRRGVSITLEQVNADPPARCDEAILSVMQNAAAQLCLTTRRMVSRAYHDSLFMARLAPAAMLFIPCRNGVSHRPDEFATVESVGYGVQVLAETLRHLSA